MKKIVSLALSTAMALSMFASVTSAATMTTQEKYNALVTQGIFAGYPDGNAYLDKDMTRAEFAKVVALLTGLDTAATGTNSYQDQNYANAWYKPYVEAVTKAGYMKGTSTGAKKLFNPNGKVTVQEMAATLVRAAKLEVPTTGINNTAAAWAKGEVQAAINAGLVPATSNFTAAATRGLLVDTAYAFQTAVNKPAVTSYEVQDNGATVIFTLANGEKVTVKPEKALVANTATTVNFKYGEFEYSESVTWTVTDATAVTSAAANNLKEVTVTFNGKVDAASATNVNNYNVADRNIEEVTLSEDGRVATILLAAGSTLTNQRETYVQVSNVKQATGTTTVTQRVTFTPNDVTAPTVETVTGLGTAAVQIKFSEPVQESSLRVANFTIDGRAISATVEYAYPDSVILVTNLTEGAHTLRVSGVQDYSGLTVAPVEQSFTVTADTAAPKVVSSSSKDLREVTLTFDEPVRSVGTASANVSSFTGTTRIEGNRVIITFSNNLNYGSNAITVTNVRDYSGNAATATATVTPTLDLTPPTVTSTKFEQVGANYIATIQLSKAVTAPTATDRNNYVLKDSRGNVVKTGGLNADGHPIQQPTLNNTGTGDSRTVTVNLGQGLTDTYYTLTVSGLRDTTVAGNILLPYDARLDVNQASNGVSTRAWVQGSYVFFEFNKAVAVSGNGNALDAAKYRVEIPGQASQRLTDRNSDIETYGADTVRIYARNFVNNGTVNTLATGNKTIVGSYIADASGNYFTDSASTNNTYEVRQAIRDSATAATVVDGPITVNSARSLSVTFNGALAVVNPSDFVLSTRTGVAGSYTYTPIAAKATGHTLSNNNRTVTLTFDRDIPSAEQLFLSVNATTTRDQFNNRIDVQNRELTNEIRPTVTAATVVGTPTANADGTKDVTVRLTTSAPVTLNGASQAVLTDLFTARSISGAATVEAVRLVTPGAAAGSPAPTNSQTIELDIVMPNTNNTTNEDLSITYTADSNRIISTVNATPANRVALATTTEIVSVPFIGAFVDNVAPDFAAGSGAITAQIAPQDEETIVFDKPLNETSRNAVTATLKAGGAFLTTEWSADFTTVTVRNPEPAVGGRTSNYVTGATNVTVTNTYGVSRTVTLVNITATPAPAGPVATAFTGQIASGTAKQISFNKVITPASITAIENALNAAPGSQGDIAVTIASSGASGTVLDVTNNDALATAFTGNVTVTTVEATDGTSTSNVIVRTN